MINFLNENIRTVKISKVPTKIIYKRYKLFCKFYKEKRVDYKTFIEELKKLKLEIKWSGGELTCKGVYLLKCKY